MTVWVIWLGFCHSLNGVLLAKVYKRVALRYSYKILKFKCNLGNRAAIESCCFKIFTCHLKSRQTSLSHCNRSRYEKKLWNVFEPPYLRDIQITRIIYNLLFHYPTKNYPKFGHMYLLNNSKHRLTEIPQYVKLNHF